MFWNNFNMTKQATSATTALIYITVGALTDVWTVIYYLWLQRHEGSDNAYLVCYGFFFSGLVLMLIGLGVGKIGRSARPAEVAPAPDTVVAPPTAQVVTPATGKGIPTAVPISNGTVTPTVAMPPNTRR